MGSHDSLVTKYCVKRQTDREPLIENNIVVVIYTYVDNESFLEFSLIREDIRQGERLDTSPSSKEFFSQRLCFTNFRNFV